MKVRPRILVVVGSTRTERFADHPLAWVTSRLTERPELDMDVLDIRDLDLPLYDHKRPPAVARRLDKMGFPTPIQRWQSIWGWPTLA